MRRPHTITIAFLLMGMICLSFVGLPVGKKVLADETVRNTSINPFDQITVYVNIGETLYIFIQSSSPVTKRIYISGSIGSLQYTGQILNFQYNESFSDRSGFLSISISSDNPAPTRIYVYVEGGDEVRYIFYTAATLLVLTGMVLEILIRRHKFPYFEEEIRSISIVGIVIPLLLIVQFFFRQSETGYFVNYDYSPGILIPRYYFVTLHIEAIASQLLSRFGYRDVLIYSILGLSFMRSLYQKRLKVYRTLPISALKQYFARVLIWTGISWVFFTLYFLIGGFSRNGKFPGYGTFFSVHIYAYFLVSIVIINLIILHVNVLDTLQMTRLSILVVPLLIFLSSDGTISSIPMFEHFHPVNWNVEYFPVPISALILKQLSYTLLLLLYGVLNRKRSGFRTGS